MTENLGWTCPQCRAALSPTTTTCPSAHTSKGWNPYPYPPATPQTSPYTPSSPYSPFQYSYGTNTVTPLVINCSTCYE